MGQVRINPYPIWDEKGYGVGEDEPKIKDFLVSYVVYHLALVRSPYLTINFSETCKKQIEPNLGYH
jgi:hypothetical protein